MVIDSASSATAYVNIANAAALGQAIPAPWALDAGGIPTTDAAAALQGSIAPAGGHKGGAVALMVEVLAAGLTGAHWSFQASSLGNDPGGPLRLGQTFIAVDPTAMADGFADRIEVMLAARLAQDGVRLPGARRQANAAQTALAGVSISGAEAAMLSDLTGQPVLAG